MNELRIYRRRESAPGSLAPPVPAGEDLTRGAGGSRADDLSRHDPGEAHSGGGQASGDEGFSRPLNESNSSKEAGHA